MSFQTVNLSEVLETIEHSLDLSSNEDGETLGFAEMSVMIAAKTTSGVTVVHVSQFHENNEPEVSNSWNDIDFYNVVSETIRGNNTQIQEAIITEEK